MKTTLITLVLTLTFALPLWAKGGGSRGGGGGRISRSTARSYSSPRISSGSKSSGISKPLSPGRSYSGRYRSYHNWSRSSTHEGGSLLRYAIIARIVTQAVGAYKDSSDGDTLGKATPDTLAALYAYIQKRYPNIPGTPDEKLEAMHSKNPIQINTKDSMRWVYAGESTDPWDLEWTQKRWTDLTYDPYTGRFSTTDIVGPVIYRKVYQTVWFILWVLGSIGAGGLLGMIYNENRSWFKAARLFWAWIPACVLIFLMLADIWPGMDYLWLWVTWAVAIIVYWLKKTEKRARILKVFLAVLITWPLVVGIWLGSMWLIAIIAGIAAVAGGVGQMIRRE